MIAFPPLVRLSLAVLSACAIAATADSQCHQELQPGLGVAGIEGDAGGMTVWDPDGNGPAMASLVIASMRFQGALLRYFSDARRNDLASGEWHSIGLEFDNIVNDFAADAAGRLFAGGPFDFVGGVAIAGVARWNGTAWQPLGTGIHGTVTALAILPTGELIAAGEFSAAGGVAAANIASWNGSSWSALGTGVDGAVNDLAVSPTGELLVAGDFAYAGGMPSPAIARWDGAQWSALSRHDYLSVRTLHFSPVGELYIGALHTQGWYSVSRLDGVSWSDVGQFSNWITSINTLPDGSLVCGGRPQHVYNGQYSVYVGPLTRWDGCSWSPVALESLHEVKCTVQLPDGDIAVAGRFVGLGPSYALRRFDGSDWSAFGNGLDEAVWAATFLADGTPIAGGAFEQASTANTRHIARWTGTAWAPLGLGTNGPVAALVTLPNGDLVAGGTFTTAGTAQARNLAQWNGSTWSEIGGGTNDIVLSLTAMDNGDLLVGGYFTMAGTTPSRGLARWNGTSWSDVSPGSGLVVGAVAASPAGHIFVWASSNSVHTSLLYRYDGVQWQTITQQHVCSLEDMVVLPNGDLIVTNLNMLMTGSAFATVARWSNGVWTSIGPAQASRAGPLAVLPDGDVLTVAHPPAVVFQLQPGSLLRWHGGAWHEVGIKIIHCPWLIAVGRQGQLAFGGNFTTVNGERRGYFATTKTTCPAKSTNYGSACASSNGPHWLVTDELPWLGGTFAAVGDNMSSNSLVLALTGFAATSIPLVSLCPLALPNCDGLVTPDLSTVVVPNAGTARSTVGVPDEPALLGQMFYHQQLPLELDSTGTVITIASSNALALTIGLF